MPQQSLGTIKASGVFCPLPHHSCQDSAWDNPPLALLQGASGKWGDRIPRPRSGQSSTSHGTGESVLSTPYPCYPFQPHPSPCHPSTCNIMQAAAFAQAMPSSEVLILVNYYLTAKAHSSHLLLPEPPRVSAPDSIPVPVCTCLLTLLGIFYSVMSLLGGLS